MRAMVFLGSVLYIVGLMLTDHLLHPGRSAGAVSSERLQDRRPLDRRAWCSCCSRAPLGVRALRPRARSTCAAPWRRVARSRAGMAALVVLAVLLAIGLLDSVHFRPQWRGPARTARRRYAVEVLSLLRRAGRAAERAQGEDLLGAARHPPLREGDGRTARWYVRFGSIRGSSTAGHTCGIPPAERGPDVLKRTGLGLALGAAIWLIWACSLVSVLARRSRSAVQRGASRPVARRDGHTLERDPDHRRIAPDDRRSGDRAGRRLPCPRHRQGGRGRPLPGPQEHPHRDSSSARSRRS